MLTCEAPGVREPRYSSVTARESLDNLRRRQAHPLQVQQQLLAAAPPATTPSPTQSLFDADYASVDYDEIKVCARDVVAMSNSMYAVYLLRTS